MDENYVDPATRQFTLRSLLVLMSAAAVLAAIGVKAGRDWTLVLIGLFLALANYQGVLGVMQRPRIARIALYLACAMFAVSFFMPAYEEFTLDISFPGAQGRQRPLPPPIHPGWRACFEVGYEVPLRTWEIVASPPRSSNEMLCAVFLMPLMFAATAGNIGLAGLPFVGGRLVAGKMSWYIAILAFGAVGAWLAPSYGYARVYAGYFLWCAALTVPLIVLRLPRLALIAMLAAVAVAGCAWTLLLYLVLVDSVR